MLKELLNASRLNNARPIMAVEYEKCCASDGTFVCPSSGGRTAVRRVTCGIINGAIGEKQVSSPIRGETVGVEPRCRPSRCAFDVEGLNGLSPVTQLHSHGVKKNRAVAVKNA